MKRVFQIVVVLASSAAHTLGICADIAAEAYKVRKKIEVENSNRTGFDVPRGTKVAFPDPKDVAPGPPDDVPIIIMNEPDSVFYINEDLATKYRGDKTILEPLGAVVIAELANKVVQEFNQPTRKCPKAVPKGRDIVNAYFDATQAQPLKANYSYDQRCQMLASVAEEMNSRKVRENKFKNRGGWVDKFNEILGKKTGENLIGGPWCMSFAQSCVMMVDNVCSGEKAAVFTSAHCKTVWNKTDPQQRLASPEKGCFVIWERDGKGHGHVGIVTQVEDRFLITVEGNTSGSGSGDQREGDGVYGKRTALPGNRGDLKLVGYLRPWKPD